jgi:hypothetical protein
MSQTPPPEAADGSAGEALSGTAIQAAARDPQRLEQLYADARRAKETERFVAELEARYQQVPDNVLFAAWHYRLQQATRDESALRNANWKLAVPLSVGLGLVFWLLSDPSWMLADHAPVLALLWMPITALFLIWFLTLTARRGYMRALLLSVGLAAVTAYVLLVAPLRGNATERGYFDLMILHVPLLAATAIGLAVLGWASSATNRFAFLSKSIETIGTAGVFSIAGGIFAALTYGMFAALSVELPDIFVRLLLVGGAGLIPVLAVAAVYDPALAPSEQEFRRGFGKILAVLMQALLPLTLLVLVIYIAVIPFNFAQPFVQRDVLIIYNVVLFAVMGLLVGVTPLTPRDYSPRYMALLRAGILALAALVLLVSVYALAAILYRTVGNQLTMNRAVVIGWNSINIALLIVLLYVQLRRRRAAWVDALHVTARLGTTAYVVWGTALVLLLPWLF